MGPLRFRALRSDTASMSSDLLADDVEEGPALLAAMSVLEASHGARSVCDAPARNRHGSRRWTLRDASGEACGAVYVEPTSDARTVDPLWLASGGYPSERGWWLDQPDAEPLRVH